eukprot:1160721-Pelagomonas_calceolata.AAC.2
MMPVTSECLMADWWLPQADVILMQMCHVSTKHLQCLTTSRQVSRGLLRWGVKAHPLARHSASGSTMTASTPQRSRCRPCSMFRWPLHSLCKRPKYYNAIRIPAFSPSSRYTRALLHNQSHHS